MFATTVARAALNLRAHSPWLTRRAAEPAPAGLAGSTVGGAAPSALSILLFAVLPLALLLGTTIASLREGTLAYDFHEAFLPAARAVLHGADPYRATTLATLHNGTAFVYPPLVAYLFAPLGLLPPLAAELAASALCLACALATLAVLGVRDWRCYGASLLWAPVFFTVHLGALSTVLALGVALAWRYRASSWVSGLAVGLVIAMKLFLWPLLLWFVAARAWRAATIAAGSALAFVLVPWAAIGFAALTSYPQMLHVLSATEAPEAYTISAAVVKLGGSWLLAQAAEVTVALTCTAAMVVAARAGRERAALSLALALALVASPIVWLHYFALLLVVIPLYVRRFHPVWLLPIALFVFPVTPGGASGFEVAGALLAIGASVLLAAGAREEGPRAGWSPSLRVGGRLPERAGQTFVT